MPTGQRPPIPPLHAKVEMQGTQNTHQWRNIAYLAVAGTGIGNADLNTIAAGIDSAWGTNVKPSLTAGNTLTGVKLIYIPNAGEEIQGIATTAQTGSSAHAEVADAAACYVINWNVNRYYRGGHPRWYVPGVDQTAITNGSLVSSATRTSLASAFNGFLNAVNALTSTNVTSVTLGTLSFQHANAWRNPPVFWPFATASAAGVMGTQRRRLHT